jgi:hypothetical protein
MTPEKQTQEILKDGFAAISLVSHNYSCQVLPNSSSGRSAFIATKFGSMDLRAEWPCVGPACLFWS